jgi:putative aldouronate transport system permease protein
MYLSRGEKLFRALTYVMLAVFSMAFLVPMLFVLGTSLIGVEEWARRGAFVLVPERIDLGAYRMLLGRGSMVLNAYAVSVFRVVVGTLLNLLVTATFAYALARRDLPGRTFFTLMVFVTMLFSGGLIPTFVLIDTLGLMNSLWVLILPALMNPWWMLIMRNFFMAIPQEIEEAAIIDGATPPRILVSVILPISLPSLATIGLFYAVWHWNEWFMAAIYLREQVKYPIQLILRAVLMMGTQSYRGEVMQMMEADVMPPAQTLKAATIIVSTVPILVVYPFLQKHFVKGATLGSVKG